MKKLIAATSFLILFGFAGTLSAGDGFGIRAGLFGFDIVNVNLDLPSSSGSVQSRSVYYITSPDPSLSISTSPRPAVTEKTQTINVVNSTNVNITVQESKSTSVQPSKPVVIYYPPQTPSYYFYRPFGW